MYLDLASIKYLYYVYPLNDLVVIFKYDFIF